MSITPLYPSRHSSDLEDEACAWLIRLDADKPFTSAELAELREWVQRSPAHPDALNRISLLWERMDVLTQLAVPLGQVEPPRSGMLQLRTALPALAPRTSIAAAALALVAVVTLAWLMLPLALQAPLSANGYYSTRVGEVVTLHLVDGSIAQLNTNTQVEVHYDEAKRTIRLLKGEAHFDVVHNPDLPFLVYAGSGAVRAVGTAFDVRLMDTEILVTVTQGRVVLESADTVSTEDRTPSGEVGSHPAVEPRERSLTAGQRTWFPNPHQQIDAVQTLTTPQLAMQLSWRKGLLTFAGEPLEEVVADISRYTDLSVVIVDPTIKTVRIGGQFKIGETDALLDVLQTSFGIAVHHVSSERVELSAARS